MAAIGSVALYGPAARDIVGQIFSGSVPACGRSFYGTIRDGDEVIDSVVAACERPDCFVIHCHGNPLLVERIVRLCQRLGAVTQRSEDYLLARYCAESETLIEAEARLAMTQAATLDGVEWIGRQISGGLSQWVRRWLAVRPLDLDRLRLECAELLDRSAIAKRIIEGVRIALIWVPNSGKSTLLNWLAGTKEALVSETAGTTRDWVSTTCRIGPLRAELIDTAGVEAAMAAQHSLERAAQEVAMGVMQSCDLVLSVRDCTRKQAGTVAVPDPKPVLTVFTKSDLLAEAGAFTAGMSGAWVLVSAAADHGLDGLSRGILSVLKADSMPLEEAVCFSCRQREAVRHIVDENSEQSVIKELAKLLGVQTINL